MDLNNLYDKTDPVSISKYSKQLIGKSFNQVLKEYFIGDDNLEGNFLMEEDYLYLEARKKFNNPRTKGSLGNLIEEYFFGYKPNSSPEPDFPEAGVELKVTPYEITKTGKVRAGERLVLGMIPNNEPIASEFDKSVAYSNLELLLLILYLRTKGQDRVEHPIKYTQLISINSEALEKDFEIIRSDYEIIASKIQDGRAHELSEADTMYLGAATKGATAKKSLQNQFYNPEVKAKRRAFSLKQGYMTSFINNYIIQNISTYDEITDETLSKEEFEKLVLDKIDQFSGWSETQLREKFDLIDTSSKSIFSTIALEILGVHTENAEEFEKSNTEVKTIRVEENGSIKESMSFPAISFGEFVKEEWEDSTLYNYFSETRFLFVVFSKVDGEYHLNRALFWHMPVQDLEGLGKKDWLRAQQTVKDGVKFTLRGKTILNTLPKMSNTEIFHLRPHASLSAYYLPSLDNYTRGDIHKNGDRLPNGDYMTKQCFWLNSKYVKKQIVGR